MTIITNEIKEFLNKQKLGFVATVSAYNTPNVSPRGTITAWGDQKLVFVHIKSPQTMLNLKTNPNVEISVVDPITRRGYCIKGKGEILNEGDEYSQIIFYYKKNGIKSEIHAVVLVSIDSIEIVTSPLYDLGYSEAELVERWKKHYLENY